MGPDSKRAHSKFAIKETKDGEVIGVGNVKITVVHTPGHTLESSCYVLTDSNNTDTVIFSGDTVFLGEVGRPDLSGN
jgi:glyoxylase-like metal-dependent hydrolase (beta-lactamase superfamily II)